MNNDSSKFSWVKTHRELAKYISTKRNNQPELIELLKSAGVNVQDDKSSPTSAIALDEIDPFTFFCYIYIYGNTKRLSILQKIATDLNLTIPQDERGIPSANAQRTWLFPFKYDRTNNEIDKLWQLFDSALKNDLTETLFSQVLTINGVGKTKLTEALFYVDPEHYFPVNGPSKPYLKEVLKINPKFDNLAEYQSILEQIKTKSKKSFPELSYLSWEYSSNKKQAASSPVVAIDEEHGAYNKPSLNQLFYGPPGTGKTYHTIFRAAEIVENRKITDYNEALNIFQSNLHDQIEFITFHQNYSYEDFIQGLRPDIENKELSFVRQDGLFTQIATNALFEYYKQIEKQKIESNNQTTNEPSLLEVYGAFFKSLKKEQKFETKAGSSIQITGFSKSRNVEYAHFENGRPYLVSQDRLLKLFTIYPKINEIQKLHDNIRSAIGGCNTTVYYVALREFIRFRDTYIEDYDQELSDGDIYDELKYDDISYTRKKELLNEISLDEIRTIDTFDAPSYVLIIDEINRANISRVFGELITLIEPDKRSHGNLPLTCTLPSGDRFIVPSNLYIIGTMNTADKSIALLDIALRRRFEFVPMYPNITLEGVNNTDVLQKINEKIIDLKTRDFTIGHSYFMGDDFDLKSTIDKKIIPLLLEYFMNDEKEVVKILEYAGLEVNDHWPLELKENKTND